MAFCFFFSSRRRHTRFDCDWSSDVCSSDLDQLVERDVVSDQLKKRGVIFQPLERAMVEHRELFRKHFMSQPAILGSAKFAALHQALVSSGTFLYVPRGV